MPSPAEPVLTCEHLDRFLGADENRVQVLEDVSLALYPGLLYSVMGPSGCGKSTLLYLLGLLDRPDYGVIRLAGHEVSALDDAGLSHFRNQEIGFVFQFHFLLKEFSALENVQLPMRRAHQLNRSEMNERAEHLLELVGLGDKIHRQANHLSGGEQQRVAIARAMANGPRLLLADEPTGNLDVRNSERVFSVLRQVTREMDTALLVVTHNTKIGQDSDHVFNMEDGRLSG